MNNHYKKNLFVIPDPFIPKQGARIMSLQNPDQKMSKSDDDLNGALFLTDSDDVLAKKIKRAVTDSGSEITWSDEKPGLQNLLSIQAALLGESPETIAKNYSGKTYGALKVETAEIVVNHMRPIRQKLAEFSKDKSYLDKIYKIGAEKASVVAATTLKQIYDTIGFALPR